MRFDAARHKTLIPKALRRARKEANLSIEEAARKSGIDQLTIQNHEWGRNLPTMEYFIFELQTHGLDFGRFHELLVEVHADLQHDEVCGELDELRKQLQSFAETSRNAPT